MQSQNGIAVFLNLHLKQFVAELTQVAHLSPHSKKGLFNFLKVVEV